jgi:hypothetical protein
MKSDNKVHEYFAERKETKLLRIPKFVVHGWGGDINERKYHNVPSCGELSKYSTRKLRRF